MVLRQADKAEQISTSTPIEDYPWSNKIKILLTGRDIRLKALPFICTWKARLLKDRTVQKLIFRFGKIDHSGLAQNSPLDDRSVFHLCHGEFNFELIIMFA
jgi:hypothetical protein